MMLAIPTKYHCSSFLNRTPCLLRNRRARTTEKFENTSTVLRIPARRSLCSALLYVRRLSPVTSVRIIQVESAGSTFPFFIRRKYHHKPMSFVMITPATDNSVIVIFKLPLYSVYWPSLAGSWREPIYFLD